jgi:hypothetical protein
MEHLVKVGFFLISLAHWFIYHFVGIELISAVISVCFGSPYP